MQHQKVTFKNQKFEVETAFTNQIKRLEFLNKKQLESFENSLIDKEDYIEKISFQNDKLKIENS
jgi:hypothetical protein